VSLDVSLDVSLWCEQRMCRDVLLYCGDERGGGGVTAHFENLKIERRVRLECTSENVPCNTRKHRDVTNANEMHNA
jgi:hypothetical protein